jgi:hypothetical protein
MARRLVRHQAALSVLALLALAACSKRGCACLVSYAPEIGVKDLDPFTFSLYEPTKINNGRLRFNVGPPSEEEMCPRLPDATSITLNGVPSKIDSLGGATGTQIASTVCRGGEAWWPEVPLAALPTSKLVIDDGTSKLECTLALGLPLRLVTTTVKAVGESISLVVEADAALAGTFIERSAGVGLESEATTALFASDVRSEGRRLTLPVPTKVLTAGKKHRLEMFVAIETIPSCSPPRKQSTKSFVLVTTSLPFDVEP